MSVATPLTTRGAASPTETHAGPTEIAHWYDAFSRKLLHDYIAGNVRLERAIAFIRSLLDDRVTRMLDIGCGIGASCHAFRQVRSDLEVHGIDISPENIRIAEQLFAQPGLRFAVSDGSTVPAGGPFDLISLIDVHEHIPRTEWASFHQVLATALSDRGRVVITTPSYLQQEYLQTHKPDALQIVDETLRIEDVTASAQRLQAEVTLFEYVSIWKTNDYLYAVLDRQPRYQPLPDPNRTKSAWVRATRRITRKLLSPASARRKLIRDKLGLEL